MKKSKLYTLLTYSGTLPFLACAILPYANFSALPVLGSFDRIAAVYALVIVSFMAGTHWGNYLVMEDTAPVNLFLSSNIIAIIIWLVFLSMNIATSLWVSTVAFLFLLWVDYKLFQANLITRYYFNVRRNATAIVVVSLIATVAML